MRIRSTFPQVYRLKHPRGGTYYYQVSARQKKWGLNERKTFVREEDALHYAREIEKSVQANGARTEISKDKLAHVTAYEELMKRLSPFGKKPEEAVEHFVKFLGSEVVRQAMPTVRQLVEQWEGFISLRGFRTPRNQRRKNYMTILTPKDKWNKWRLSGRRSTEKRY